MLRLYRPRPMEGDGQEGPLVLAESSSSDDGEGEGEGGGGDGGDGDGGALLQWCEALDFEAYAASWAASACSVASHHVAARSVRVSG